MRSQPILGALILIIVSICSCRAGDYPPMLGKSLDACLVFELAKDSPPHLNVYLRLINPGNADVTWTANGVYDIQADLIDGSGNPAARPPAGAATSLVTSAHIYTISGRSKMDWMISHDGIPAKDDSNGRDCRIEVGNNIWFVPSDKLSNYALSVHLRGWPRAETNTLTNSFSGPLIDVPPQKIIVRHEPELNY